LELFDSRIHSSSSIPKTQIMFPLLLLLLLLLLFCVSTAQHKFDKVQMLIHLLKKPTWCIIYLQYISSITSTCFGRIYSPLSGGTPNGYNSWYLLFFLDDVQPSQYNTQLSKKNHKYQLLYPNGVPPDYGL